MPCLAKHPAIPCLGAPKISFCFPHPTPARLRGAAPRPDGSSVPGKCCSARSWQRLLLSGWTLGVPLVGAAGCAPLGLGRDPLEAANLFQGGGRLGFIVDLGAFVGAGTDPRVPLPRLCSGDPLHGVYRLHAPRFGVKPSQKAALGRGCCLKPILGALPKAGTDLSPPAPGRVLGDSSCGLQAAPPSFWGKTSSKRLQ